MLHEVKSWNQFFSEIVAGRKRHELRRNDRGYRVGDTLLLREFDPASETYTGRTGHAEITSMTSADNPCAVSNEALRDGFCVLTIRLVRWADAHTAAEDGGPAVRAP
jgi:hypothetical protein